MLGLHCRVGFSLAVTSQGGVEGGGIGWWGVYVWHAGFSLQWLFLLWSAGLVAPRQVGSSQIRDWTGVSCIGRQIFLPLSHQVNPCTFFFFGQPCYLWVEKAMAPHSSTLAWKIPWMEEPGGLQSMGSLRVRHNWATLLSLFTFLHWRRQWQPTPVVLPGDSQGQGSLVGCCLWGHTESDTTEAT